MAIFNFIVRRTLFTVPILVGITLLTFALFNIFAGDPALRFAGKYATAVQVANVRAEMGLDKSLAEQYFHFLQQILTMDFGRSWATQQKISTMIGDGFSATVCLMFPPFFASILVCIVLAMIAVYKHGRLFDRAAVIICLALLSISSLAYILALQYLFAFRWGLFPITGWDASWIGRWQYLVLPWIIMFVLLLGGDILIYRSVFLDEAGLDYVRTARAKGLSNFSVYARHILKNAMIPIITIVVIEMPLLITGTVLIENFFAIPGIGGTLVKALNDADFPVIKFMTVIVSIAYMVFNLLADILYGLVDPRIKLT